MRKLPLFVILTHFCGLHTSSGHPMNGCRGMLRSLTTQLIVSRRHQGADTTACLDERLLRAVALYGLEALCQLFGGTREPDTSRYHTVYCLLDDISRFENRSRELGDGLCRVVHLLQCSISQRQRCGPAVKVLLIMINRSISISDQIEVDGCIPPGAGNRSSRPVQRLSIEGGWCEAVHGNATVPQPRDHLTASTGKELKNVKCISTISTYGYTSLRDSTKLSASRRRRGWRRG